MSWLNLEHIGVEVIVGTVTVLGYALSLLLLPVVLLTKKRWPASTVAWLMAIVFMPVIGGVLYLAFGTDRVTRRVSRRRTTSRLLNRSLPALTLASLDPRAQWTEAQRQLIRVARRVAQTNPTDGNRVTLFSKTSDAFAAIEAAIQQAQDSLHLEYYIWQPDHIGTRLRDLLIEKARAGVRVRFLYDSVGSMRLSAAFLEPMREAGIDVVVFVPGRKLIDRWSVNFRSHRKIIVVDGKVGFTGGMNVGDEYLGQSRHFGYWRDTHLQLEGPTVLQLQDVFAADWACATGEDLYEERYFQAQTDAGRILAQVVAGGPDCDPSVFHSLMFAAISEAQKSVTLATSYFVPTPPLVAALCAAALRGVKTRIMVAGPVTYWVTYHAARSFFDELLEAGVEVYEYRRGQQHAKTLTIDGEWSLVGTPNFDSRSVFLNFEVGVVLYDAGLAEQLEHHFDQDIEDSIAIDAVEWARRGTWSRLTENACRMFVPVL